MDTDTTVRKPRVKGTFFMNIAGLHASVRSTRSRTTVTRGMLVSHPFIELWNSLESDEGFSQSLFDQMAEEERDFFMWALNKTQSTHGRAYTNAYNKSISHHLDRLKLIQQAISIGNDSPKLIDEYIDAIDVLYNKNVFTHQYRNALVRFTNARKRQ